MRQTETQKRFKEQMKEIENEPSLYDNSRAGNPFHRQTVSIFGVIALVLVVGLVFKTYSGRKLVTEIPYKSATDISSASVEKNGSFPSSTVNQKGLIPKAESQLINKLFAAEQEVNNNWSAVSKFHRVKWESRDIKGYKQALINAIASCDIILIELDSITDKGHFEQLFLIVKEQITNSRLAFKYYLNYIGSKDASDIELGNNYLQLVNQNGDQRKIKFREILDQNGYRYEVDENGSIKYWISQN